MHALVAARSAVTHFRCPACRAWTPRGAGETVVCARCGQRVPVPVRIEPGGYRSAGPPPAQVRVACPRCGQPVAVPPDADASFCCPACGGRIGAPALLRWWRPVARYLTPHELRYSLHHLMLSADYSWWPDSAIPPEARERFDFYCGCCGELHSARVWDIGSQRYCGHCGVLMVVPVRRRPGRRGAGSDGPAPGRRLFCPQCGAAVAGDASRLGALRCGACGARF